VSTGRARRAPIHEPLAGMSPHPLLQVKGRRAAASRFQP
jgi:hypothetical protein